MKKLTVIGRVERAALPTLSASAVPVKIDTGADSSSIWAHKVGIKDGRLAVVFFGPNTPYYDGREHLFKPNEFTITRVANSFGVRELRYKIKLRIKIMDRTIKGTFTLSNRSNKLYPVLIGRALLKNKFLVDVSAGKPLVKAERERIAKLHEELVNLREVKS